MKRLHLVSALVTFVLVFVLYTNNNYAARISSNEGSLSYTVDGTKVVVKPPATSIYLNEVSHDATKGSVRIKVTIFPMGELFNFLVADKGTTDIVHYKPSFGEQKVVAVYLSKESHNFYGDHVSVTISALNAIHVTGVFSGTFTAEGKTVTIKDGSFDFPMQPKR